LKPEYEEHIQHTFDSFCKAVIKRTARECYSAIKKRSAREITFSNMSARELANLSVMDEYFKKSFTFGVLGEDVGVSNAELAEALNVLPADKRDIILMSFFFDMSDREIAECMKMARRTVAYQRTSTLRKLKKLLGEE